MDRIGVGRGGIVCYIKLDSGASIAEGYPWDWLGCGG